MAEDAALVFVIGGADYPAPDLVTFNMAERQVMYDLCGYVEEDFLRLDKDETDEEMQKRIHGMVRNPAFAASLMHVAYARGNPGLSREKVQKVIDSTNYNEAIEKWHAQEDDAADPSRAEQTSAPGEQSPPSSSASASSSGPASERSSDAPAEIPSTIGTGESGTSHTSVPIRSVA